VLNRPSLRDAVTVQTANPDVLVRRWSSNWTARPGCLPCHARSATEATFTLPMVADGTTADVLEENRPSRLRTFVRDHFAPWAVHLYQLSPTPTAPPNRTEPKPPGLGPDSR